MQYRQEGANNLPALKT